jgi:hypothetical protein
MFKFLIFLVKEIIYVRAPSTENEGNMRFFLHPPPPNPQKIKSFIRKEIGES